MLELVCRVAWWLWVAASLRPSELSHHHHQKRTVTSSASVPCGRSMQLALSGVLFKKCVTFEGPRHGNTL